MPTTIAIEAKPVEERGINSGFFHLYLVKTETDAQGNIISEKVIRGTLGGHGKLETLANADLATSPDRRGADTPEERHHTVIDLGTSNPEDVWTIMVKHAVDIDRAHLDYGFDVFRAFPGGDVNSNSVVASVLHTVGIDWTKSLPTGISKSDVPLYGQLQFMKVNDVLYGTDHNDTVFGGVGNDHIYGNGQDDLLVGESNNDWLLGGAGNDRLIGGIGDDRLYGGTGADILRGESGKDAFVFNTAPDGTTNPDIIRDFSVVDDRVWLDHTAFANLGPEGRLKSWTFWTGTAAHDATDRVIYDRAHGVLYYDPDGTGAAAQVAVAKLSAGLKMTYADFHVV